MTARVARPAARWLGVLLIVLAIAGWFDTPVIGRHGFIGADEGLSIAHAIVGLFLVVMSFSGESTSAFALYISAAVLLLFAAYVLWQLGSYDGLQIASVYATRSAEYFHLLLAVTMGVFGKMNTARQQLFRE